MRQYVKVLVYGIFIISFLVKVCYMIEFEFSELEEYVLFIVGEERKEDLLNYDLNYYRGLCFRVVEFKGKRDVSVVQLEEVCYNDDVVAKREDK